MTVGNATRLGASQRSTTRRCASHHIETAGDTRRLSRVQRGRSPSSACGSETVICSALILCRPILGGMHHITNMPGFSLRQAQAHFRGIIIPSSADRSKVY
jgi:hypothetical protein